jgi:hypothetical protein
MERLRADSSRTNRRAIEANSHYDLAARGKGLFS